MCKVADIHHFRAVEASLSTSGQPSEGQLHALADAGCEVIVNLALLGDPRYSLPDERGLVESLGMTYIHIPVQFDAPTQSDLARFFLVMEENETRKIHLHCAANMRVTVFLGLYRLVRQGQSEEEAFAPMRSVWQPDAV